MAALLVFTDFELYTYTAMHYAIDLALRSGMPLVICDSSNVTNNNAYNGSLLGFLQKFDHPLLNKYWSQVNSYFNNKQLKEIKIQYQYLADFSQKVDSTVFLAFFSTKEKGGLLNRLFRDDFSTFLENAKFPMLVLSKNTKFHRLGAVCLGTDYQLRMKNGILYCHDLAQFYESPLEFLHIIQEETQNYADRYHSFELYAAEVLGTDEFNIKAIKNTESLSDALEAFSKKNPNTLLALGKSQRSVLDKLFLTNISLDLAFSAHSPLLIYPSET